MTRETVEAIDVALGRFALARSAPRHVLLAVSGGPDSLAMLLATAERRAGLAVSAATVDHGLRPEAAGEAAFVADLCRDLGVPHRTLRWTRSALPPGNLMAAAREARYRLLTEEAQRVGADAILLAHHADDQVETHLLSRARGATGAGLAGMRDWRDLEPGLVLLRPFLGLPKRSLIDAVARAGLAPVEDPSNADCRFDRVRLRAEVSAGLHHAPTIERDLAEAGALRDVEDHATANAIRDACGDGRLLVDDAGVVSFRPVGEERALWSRLVTAAGGAPHPPGRIAVQRLIDRDIAGGRGVATLAGCRLDGRGDSLLLEREFGRTGPPASPIEGGRAAAFDRRFTIRPPLPAGAARLAPLGSLGLGGGYRRSLPVCLDRDGALLAVHRGLRDRLPELPALVAEQRVGWRIWADLPGDPPDRLTAEPQNAANPSKAVGKDLAATYLRGRVKVRAP